MFLVHLFKNIFFLGSDIGVHLAFNRADFGNGEVEVGELRGKNVPLEERGKERMCLFSVPLLKTIFVMILFLKASFFLRGSFKTNIV